MCTLDPYPALDWQVYKHALPPCRDRLTPHVLLRVTARSTMARELVRQGKVCLQRRLDEVGHRVCPTCGRFMKRKLWHMNLGTGAPCDEVPKPERQWVTSQS